MSVSSGIISAPVSVDDVAQLCWVQLRRTVSGVVQTMYSYDVGCLCGAKVGDIIPALDSDGSWTVADRGVINKWARFKSVRYQKESEITYSQRKSVYFGLQVPYVRNDGAVLNSDVYNILQTPSYQDAGWVHDMPAGGAATPYRLNDFVKKASDTLPAWAGTLAGYNHNAPFPCTVSIMSGVASMGDYLYEVNLQAYSSLTFYFANATGSDLCLQDFCDFTLEDSTKKWRPVLQMFYPTGGTPWYSMSSPSASAGGTAMSNDRTAALSVSISTTGRTLNQVYHVCLGIGCCNNDATQFPGTGSTDRLFIAPFDRSVRFIPQFYYKIRFVNYFTHAIKVVEVWYSDGSVFKQCTNSGGSQSFIAGNDIVTGGYLGVKMEITRTNLDAYFVEANTTLSVTPKMYIRAGEQIGSGTETQRNLEPKTSNYVTNPNPKYYKIEADSDYATRNPKLTTIAYAILPHGLTPTTTNTASYHMQSQMEAQGWVEVNTFSVRVSQT